MCLCIKKLNEEAVLTHLVYIIKFLVANHIAISPSIPEHISDFSLTENWEKDYHAGFNCFVLFLSGMTKEPFSWNGMSFGLLHFVQMKIYPTFIKLLSFVFPYLTPFFFTSSFLQLYQSKEQTMNPFI